jgi:predicted membrane protein
MDPNATLLPSTFWITLGVIYILILVLMLVSWWKIFVKMGRPGWEGIIPVYNIWVLIKMLKKPQSWFWIVLIGALLLSYVSQSTQQQVADQVAAGSYMSGGLILANLLQLVVAIVLLVYSVKIYHALSKAFGHDSGFTVGLVLLSIIFLPILAFGDSRFQLEE